MAQEKLIDQPLQTITRKLAADVLASAVPVPVMATANENEVKVVDAQNALIEGILRTPGKAGDLKEIVVAGITPMRVDAAVSRAGMLMTSADATVFTCPLTSGTTYNLAGTAMTKATVAQEFVSVQIRPQKLRLKT